MGVMGCGTGCRYSFTMEGVISRSGFLDALDYVFYSFVHFYGDGGRAFWGDTVEGWDVVATGGMCADVGDFLCAVCGGEFSAAGGAGVRVCV